ncbi:hypothetical protein BO221_21375 [Archangium sp. Cb G35]|nr:hypothetical protein BO221_21375 [Archangium sp. Cb G35]
MSSRGWSTGLVLGALLLAGRAGADSPPSPDLQEVLCTSVSRSDDLRCVEHPATLPGARPPSRQGPDLYCETPMEGSPLLCHALD